MWIAADVGNAGRVWDALRRFGAPAAALGFSPDDLLAADQVLQIGVPPRRIDVLTSISGVDFDFAWPHRAVVAIAGLDVPFIGRADLVANKRATGRVKDIADLEALGER